MCSLFMLSMILLVRRSSGRRWRASQEEQGAEVAVLRGCRLRPVEAVQT